MTAPSLPVAHALDARPVVVYTVHCGSCGVVYVGEEGPAWFTIEQLTKLGSYELDGWQSDSTRVDPDFAGHPLVCPKCWEVGWCEECNSAIHVWERFEYETHEDDIHWHAKCCTGDHKCRTLPATLLRDEAARVEPVGGTQ